MTIYSAYDVITVILVSGQLISIQIFSQPAKSKKMSTVYTAASQKHMHQHIEGCEDLWINLPLKEKASKKLTIGAI